MITERVLLFGMFSTSLSVLTSVTGISMAIVTTRSVYVTISKSYHIFSQSILIFVKKIGCLLFFVFKFWKRVLIILTGACPISTLLKLRIIKKLACIFWTHYEQNITWITPWWGILDPLIKCISNLFIFFVNSCSDISLTFTNYSFHVLEGLISIILWFNWSWCYNGCIRFAVTFAECCIHPLFVLLSLTGLELIQ